MKKKIAAVLTIAVLAVALLPTAALAHGHGGMRQTCPICPVENCNATGIHKHDGTGYLGHTLNDGHGHHQACTVEDCPLLENHLHNGVECLPQGSGQGHHGGHKGNGHR